MQKKDREREIADELARQPIAVQHQERDLDVTAKNVNVAGIKITGEGESMQIQYSFRRKEIKILQIMAAVSGASMEWHAHDVVLWA